MADLTPETALLRLYVQAAKTLRVQIRHALESGQLGTAAYRAQQLQAVETIVRNLGRRSRPLRIPIVFDSYVRGAHIVQIAEGQAVAAFQFAGVHTQAARVVAANLATKLDAAEQLIGRRTDDAFRRVALEIVGERGVIAGQTRREVSAALQRQLIEEGVTDAVTGFVDRGGRRWQLDTYAEMVARTTTREAMTAGTANRMGELGLDLVTISDHSTDCEICKPFEGNTYSLTGATPGYDVLPDGGPPWHPHCWHVMTPAGANLAALERQLGIGVFTRR